jgi:hypothetical protein
MKLIWIMLFMEPDTKTGGFSEAEKTELKGALDAVQTALETKQKAIVEAALALHMETLNASMKKFGDWQIVKDTADQANQKALDEMLIKFKEMQKGSAGGRIESKSLQQAIYEALQDPENIKGLDSVRSGNRFKMALKGPIDLSAPAVEWYDPSAEHKAGKMQTKVGDMTGANILTGQGVVSYNNRQAILPAQKVNARDLIPTVHSDTGIYVTYRETAGQGSISRQTTEGAAKTQIDFRFTRIETVNEFVAGWAKFGKQLMRNLPWLQNTLPRLLQREFFKVENRLFWDIMATAYAAGGPATTSTETDDLLQTMDFITQLFDTDYVASFGLLRYTALNRINKSILTHGYYPGAGGITSGPAGNIMINGTPIYPVTWIPSYDKFLTFDSDYVERVEVESLAIEFFEQDSDNVEKNLMTARIECYEAFNEMQPASLIIGDFGNSSTS